MLVTNVETYDDGTCEALTCFIENINHLVAVLYRAPDAPYTCFQKIMHMIQSYITQYKHQGTKLYITGDFNQPNISWHERRCNKPGALDVTNAIKKTIEVMSENFLTQIVRKPTRMGNILDIVLTNAEYDVIQVSSSETQLSDHNLVKVTLGYYVFDNQVPIETKAFKKHTFHSLNTRRGNYDEMRREMKTVKKEDWQELFHQCPEDQKEYFYEILRLSVLQFSCRHIPEKIARGKSTKIPRERKVIQRKKYKLRAKLGHLQRTKSSPQLISKVSAE